MLRSMTRAKILTYKTNALPEMTKKHILVKQITQIKNQFI